MTSVPIVTLTTDFGLQDGFVGTLKGVILGICPSAQIVDISHDIPPQDILAAGLTLQRAYAYFPDGTVHVAVVDPGVGTSRRPIAIRACGQVFVGPDNGLFSFVFTESEERNLPVALFHLTDARYWLLELSSTFHGRDLFSPVAAHLACGVELEEMGKPINDPVLIPFPKPSRTATGWQAHIIAIDRFGNLATDLPAAWINEPAKVAFHLAGREIRGLSSTYRDGPAGRLVALIDSEGRLEIAVACGSAARVTGVQVGDIVEVVESAHLERL
jgi:S-adenosylmethionine hydrolase